MIRVAIGLFVIAAIAAIFGYGIANDSTGVGRSLFVVFLVAGLFALIVGLARRSVVEPR